MLAAAIRSIGWSVALALLAPAPAPLPAEAVPAALPDAPDAAEQPPAREWTAQEDHQNMMDQLGIKTLRRGADGRNRQAPNFQPTAG